ncbi:lipocalin family protein [Epibacterium sp. DP7N7-1]|nr:lipocalin family protein [Epibacterium sp. DP7N7-1]MCZ4267300.1 lipocalin family protein [Rhodobacteraceae bacterium G21628-S1]MEE2810435.1 lipocalin family protein [Pseudomonadota bacterium]NKX29323.1 lipocalin family protein [Rhodobacteraceae bacterium R_SAG6]NKX75883.1 lipocalin family protein [Rhodobacteraceae bacterium R_SAG3]
MITSAVRTTFAVSLAVLTVSTSAQAGGYRDTDVPLTVEEDLDLSRYLGKWYEVARFPNNFEMGCEGVTAEYSALPEDRIKVVNSCHKGGLNGPIDTAEGVARVTGPGMLEVNFVPWLRILPFTWGDYWVLNVDTEYEVAVIGTPKGKHGWILARTPEISAEQLTEAKSVLRDNGYDIGALEMVPQN